MGMGMGTISRPPCSSLFSTRCGVRRVCCWAPRWQDIDRYWRPAATAPQHGVQQQMRAVPCWLPRWRGWPLFLLCCRSDIVDSAVTAHNQLICSTWLIFCESAVNSASFGMHRLLFCWLTIKTQHEIIWIFAEFVRWCQNCSYTRLCHCHLLSLTSVKSRLFLPFFLSGSPG